MGGKEREGEGGLYLRVVGTRTHNAKRAEGCDNETFGSTLDQPLSPSLYLPATPDTKRKLYVNKSPHGHG